MDRFFDQPLRHKPKNKLVLEKRDSLLRPGLTKEASNLLSIKINNISKKNCVVQTFEEWLSRGRESPAETQNDQKLQIFEISTNRMEGKVASLMNWRLEQVWKSYLSSDLSLPGA